MLLTKKQMWQKQQLRAREANAIADTSKPVAIKGILKKVIDRFYFVVSEFYLFSVRQLRLKMSSKLRP
jgi:hypothetical protein